MRRNCRQLYKPQGKTKVEVIKELINKKLREEHEKKVPEIVIFVGLTHLDEQIKDLEEKMKKTKKLRHDIMDAQKIGQTYKYDKNDKGKYVYCASNQHCYLPKKIDDKIQKIILLRKLLKNKEAQELEQELIDEYNLTEL